MKKILLIIGIMSSYISFSQVSINLSAGSFYQIENAYSVQKGLNISFKYNLKENLRFGFDLGYYSTNTFVKYTNRLTTLSSVPLTGAVEYSLGKKDFKPFIGIGIGMYNISKGDDVKFVSINKFGYNSHFGITPILGFDYVLTDKLSVIGNAKYIFIPGNSASRLQLNAGVGFHF